MSIVLRGLGAPRDGNLVLWGLGQVAVVVPPTPGGTHQPIDRTFPVYDDRRAEVGSRRKFYAYRDALTSAEDTRSVEVAPDQDCPVRDDRRASAADERQGQSAEDRRGKAGSTRIIHVGSKRKH